MLLAYNTSAQDMFVKRARRGETVLREESALQECAHPHVIGCYGSSCDGTELMIERGETDLYDVVATRPDCHLESTEALDHTR